MEQLNTMLVGIHALASGVVGSALSDHIGADIFTIQSMTDNFITELIACCHKAELIICGACGQIIFSHQSIVDFIHNITLAQIADIQVTDFLF